jgi:hypothetical protein
LIEVFTGCDLVTGEDLGWWRLAGIIGLSELRHLRHADDAYTWAKQIDYTPPLPRGARANRRSGVPGGSGGPGKSLLRLDPRLKSPATLAGNTSILPSDQGTVTKRLVIQYAERMVQPDFTWDRMPKIEIIHASNGHFIVHGHHRFLASRLAGMEIPKERIHIETSSGEWTPGTEWEYIDWD